MGEFEKAKTQKSWFIGIAAVLVLLTAAAAALPESKVIDAASRFVSLPLLLAWYYSGGKAQRTFVEARFGPDYPHRGWLKPIGAVVAAFVLLIVIAAFVALIFG